MDKALKVRKEVRKVILKTLKENNRIMAMSDLELVIIKSGLLGNRDEAREALHECRRDGFIDNRVRWSRLRMENSVTMIYLIPESSRFRKEIRCIESFLEKVGGHAAFSAIEKALIKECLIKSGNISNILRFVSKLPNFSCNWKTETIFLRKK